jgi:hypothetical protein
MHQTSHFSPLTLLLLLMSAANLYGIGVSMWWYRHSEPATPAKPMREKWGILALILSSCSQLLYLLFFFAWLFQWIHFYPGNPIENIAILCGRSFSTAALCIAFFGPSSQRIVTIVVAVTTTGMWLLAAVASVAV